MIKGFCKTNLDDYKYEEWPTKFVALPRVGDLVESKDGKVLRIVSISHCESHDIRTAWSGPYILVELHRVV